MTFHINDLSVSETQYYLQHIVAPRPVCFASTINRHGHVNLSPFSFFNLFSANPPIVVFSPARRVRDNTVKHTLENVLQIPEVVINVVTYDMVQQVSLSSCDYPREIDEFVKAGFTKEKATMVAPPMVKESRAKLECRVTEIKSLGDGGGAGQLVIAEVVCFHIHDEVLTTDKKVMQEKLELVGRLGADWYARVSPSNLFKIDKPDARLAIGFDALPEGIKNSTVLTGNNLAQLASVYELPIPEPGWYDGRVDALCYYFDEDNRRDRIHAYARELLEEGKVAAAWQTLLSIHETR